MLAVPDRCMHVLSLEIEACNDLANTANPSYPWKGIQTYSYSCYKPSNSI